jgi:glycosyltransferase involved in cell wall biosynthesis
MYLRLFPTIFLRANLKTCKVAILLCTHNGEQFLPAQLDSIAAQTHSKWVVWVSDDSPNKSTQNLIQSYQQKWSAGRLFVQAGPRAGFAANFMSLACQADIEADYFAFCDQDDIWEANKLERAVKWLDTVTSDTPALYCSRTRLVDENNQEIGLSPLFSKPPSFANALMQNIAGGNTMVFNRAARLLIMEAGRDLSLHLHDWWTYLIVSGCGGQVLYDSNPTLRYRQHSANQVGMNCGWRSRIKRIQLLWQGRFKSLSAEHIDALQRLQHRLTPDSVKTLDLFILARKSGLFKRLWALNRAGIYRQTLIGNLGLLTAAVFNRM